MIYLITGGSGSGKSAYGEKLAVTVYKKLHDGLEEREENKLYYIATMHPYDEEGLKRIERHRKMRDGKGFETIECAHHLERVAGIGSKDVVLLECMSNLLANEMYMEEGQLRSLNEGELWEQIKKAIVQPIINLGRKAGCVIVITNEVFSDGTDYGEETNTYCRMLGMINRMIAEEADMAAEVVCGIPVSMKGELPC